MILTCGHEYLRVIPGECMTYWKETTWILLFAKPRTFIFFFDEPRSGKFKSVQIRQKIRQFFFFDFVALFISFSVITSAAASVVIK